MILVQQKKKRDQLTAVAPDDIEIEMEGSGEKDEADKAAEDAEKKEGEEEKGDEEGEKDAEKVLSS